jgi:hypothetical protein
MKIEYISHSCFTIDTGKIKLIMDPWFKGPCYKNQWNLFPKPVNISDALNATHIIVTHGHQDHLHEESLCMLRKDADFYFPYLWTKSVKPFLAEIGFKKVNELTSYQTVSLDEETKITFIANSLDGIVVVEHKDKVIVNLNDALNAHHKSILHHFLKNINERWSKIDYLFCGLGGAGYFPNTVHYNGKDDKEIGELREQFLAHQFCKIILELKPEAVIPFTPGFALLAKDKLWINALKFPRELLDGYYKDNFDAASKVKFINMYPGDLIDEDTFKKHSPYYEKLVNGSLSHLVEEMYAGEIDEYNSVNIQPALRLDEIILLLNKWISKSASVYNNELLDLVKFSLKLSDVDGDEHLFIHYDNGIFLFEKRKTIHPKSLLTIVTTAEAIEYSLSDEWGGDILFVGYAADVFVENEIALENNLDIVCLRLLTRYPTASRYMMRNPIRGMRFMLSNPSLTELMVKNKMLTRGNPNKLPFNERSHWINKTKCEVCMACDIPLLSHEFGELMEMAEKEA